MCSLQQEGGDQIYVVKQDDEQNRCINPFVVDAVIANWNNRFISQKEFFIALFCAYH